MIFCDTNVIIYLFSGYDAFPKRAVAAIEQNDCFISPMVHLELQYLYEVKRTKHKPEMILNALYKEIGVSVHNHYFHPIVLEAIHAPWTRDPFDRLITAHAKAMDSVLLTTDQTILKHYKKALWE
jgi:PIN domain nuclease of toxin-antitoxin system